VEGREASGGGRERVRDLVQRIPHIVGPIEAELGLEERHGGALHVDGFRQGPLALRRERVEKRRDGGDVVLHDLADGRRIRRHLEDVAPALEAVHGHDSTQPR